VGALWRKESEGRLRKQLREKKGVKDGKKEKKKIYERKKA
jgi:hypothetical protein